MTNDLLEQASTKEGREELIAFMTEMKSEIYPFLGVMKQEFGEDADTAVNEAINYIAKKTQVALFSYMEHGFSREEAINLICSVKTNLANAKK